ncbi:MAG: porphobilinogen synthase [Saprospiraceae bacterium]|jgi:porphobilinogen synthase
MNSRPRRNRISGTIRSMVQETTLSCSNLVYPLFIVDGNQVKDEIKSLPHNFRWSLDLLLGEVQSCIDLKINSFILFPIIKETLKDSTASYSYDENNFYLKAIQTIKNKFPEVCLISDVAMDPYSSDGHDGLVKNGSILNDETLPVLAKMAVAQAKHGIDIVGPSDMMDGRIAYIREALDDAGYENTGIMAYSAKYASAFYGPFRDALDSEPKSGDKKTYQMDPANSIEAEREAQLDFEEGADFLMVKPALHYMDIIRRLKDSHDLPIVAYHVSGECAMLQAACDNGWLDFKQAMPETLLSLKRAGSDIIITYFAKQYAELNQ